MTTVKVIVDYRTVAIGRMEVEVDEKDADDREAVRAAVLARMPDLNDLEASSVWVLDWNY